MGLTAIHIRTGEAGLNRTIESWLERFALPTRTFADAYEACVYLIANASAVPDVAFIGADWLTAEEWPIVRYLQDTWPSLAVIVYAGRRVTGLPDPVGLRAVCTSARMLDRILEREPDNLLRDMRLSTDDFPADEPRVSVRPPPVAVPGDVAPAEPVEVRGNGAQSAALTGEGRRNNNGGERQARQQEIWLLSGQED